MRNTIFFLVIFVTFSIGCKKKIPKDALTLKIAGMHAWSGMESVMKAFPLHHSTDSIHDISFYTTIYAITGESFMYFDSSLGTMDTFHYVWQDSLATTYYFQSTSNRYASTNTMRYSLLQDSISWQKNFLRAGKQVGWIVHSP